MMSPQETQALQDFLAQLTQVRGITKDPQASNLIDAALAQQPDAGYLLVQRAMLQNQALQAARLQLNDLQTQLRTEREGRPPNESGTNFMNPAAAWGNSAVDESRRTLGSSQRYEPTSATQYANPSASQQAFPQVPQTQYANVPAPRSSFFGGGTGSSFLGSMAATAAGVAGGAFLFQGIENLMGHHGGGAGLLGQNGNATPLESTTVNNFYGSGNDSGNDSEKAASEPASLADDGFDDFSANEDFGNNDDLGSADDMSSI